MAFIGAFAGVAAVFFVLAEIFTGVVAFFVIVAFLGAALIGAVFTVVFLTVLTVDLTAVLVGTAFLGVAFACGFTLVVAFFAGVTFLTALTAVFVATFLAVGLAIVFVVFLAVDLEEVVLAADFATEVVFFAVIFLTFSFFFMPLRPFACISV
ncbi:MAG: hypothetical protein IAE63_05270 [Alphaproteobacteria bacterium]|nr:hypothetical protein [Alphaproteobacteria bacterium]MCB9984830.1 hypothetical protein [Micavibrio sp.]